MRTFISRRPAQRVPANLNQLLCEVLELLDSELRHAGVKTELKLDDRLPAVSVDRIQIQQVLVNMIRNAVEAMTLLENDTRRLSICTTIADKQVRIGIADTGGGLAPSISARLFEPFHTTKPSGLGLGLAICRTLVEAHGGSIGAEPNPMRGTTFFFSLPVVQDEATS
jgi:C4-dicarboxylate-specific signal transduction histidine kinase